MASADLLLRDVEVRAVLVGLGSVGGPLHRPGQWRDEGHDQVDQRPPDDDVVVGDDAEGGEDGGEADTSQPRVDASEDTDVTALKLLTERHLHERDGNANEDQARPVGDEEEGSSPGEAQVGEAPEVAEADAVAHHREDVGHPAEPARTLGALVLIFEDAEARFFASHVNLKFNYTALAKDST